MGKFIQLSMNLCCQCTTKCMLLPAFYFRLLSENGSTRPGQKLVCKKILNEIAESQKKTKGQKSSESKLNLVSKVKSYLIKLEITGLV